MNRVGLVLSGGGARGFAHIGIIKMMDELKVRPASISGCSMGAIIGALYCLGHSGKDIENDQPGNNYHTDIGGYPP